MCQCACKLLQSSSRIYHIPVHGVGWQNARAGSFVRFSHEVCARVTLSSLSPAFHFSFFILESCTRTRPYCTAKMSKPTNSKPCTWTIEKNEKKPATATAEAEEAPKDASVFHGISMKCVAAQLLRFPAHLPIVSVGSGNGVKEFCIASAGVAKDRFVCVDPEPESFDKFPGNLEECIQPSFALCKDLVAARPDLVGACILLLMWPNTTLVPLLCKSRGSAASEVRAAGDAPPDAVGYDFEAIQMLNPVGLVCLYELAGAAGSNLLHKWCRLCGDTEDDANFKRDMPHHLEVHLEHVMAASVKEAQARHRFLGRHSVRDLDSTRAIRYTKVSTFCRRDIADTSEMKQFVSTTELTRKYQTQRKQVLDCTIC